MYSLVKFDNQECLITLSKKVKIIQGQNYLIKTNRGSYQGYLLNTDGKLTLIIYITSKYNLLNKFHREYSLGTDDHLLKIFFK